MKYTSENMNYIFNVSYFDDIDWAAFGSSKEENDSILMWNGERCEPEEIPVIDTYEDHRMAMAFAPAVICHPNLLIADPQVVTKSYPGYWGDLKQAGFQVINEG